MKFAVIFDMDGVLVDSVKHIVESFKREFNKYGINYTDEEHKQHRGSSIGDFIKAINKKYNTNLEIEQFRNNAWVTQQELLKSEVINKDLIKLIKELHSKKIPLAVGTSSDKPRTEAILNLLKIKNYFQAIITADDVKEHKPNPHIFLAAAEKLKVKPENCIVIEDAESGIQAAKRSNMKAIGYLFNSNYKDRLREADLIVTSFSQLSYNKLKELFKLKNKI